MENQIRLFLFLALGVLALLTWTAWQEDYAGPPVPAPTRTTATTDAPAPRAPAPAATAETPSSDADAGDEAMPVGQTVHVVTDLFDIEIATRGGGIVSARLRQYDVAADNPAPFPLLQIEAGPLFVAQSGLVADAGEAPDHRSTWQAARTEYRLSEGENQLVVPLTWRGPDGVTVTKRYIFTRGSYTIEMAHRVENTGAKPWRAYQYTQLRREPVADDGGGLLLFATRAYSGGAYYSPAEKYEKVSYEQMREGEPLSRDVVDGWVAMVQHYFVAAWVPPRGLTERYYTRVVDGNEYLIGMSSPWQTIAAGATADFRSWLYAGPKAQDRLDEVAPGLALTVDYGWLTIIAKPLFIALSWIHGVVGNWGWAIVILTILIKAVFYKLSETSYRSMARMRKLQPRMQQLKERLGDDRQRMNQELMELYKREKVNPLGGCLPIVIQIPVFIALYWVLLGSVELRQAPWILWIDDLAQRDPYFVLPLIMGATMFLQQRLNPAPVDPIQQRVMMFLPLVFTVFFLFFPAGLVLYWVTNNSLSILQQWIITRRIERGDDEKPARKAGKKKQKKG